MISTDEKLYQYQFNVCDKSFSSSSKVKAHMVAHNEEEGYQCSVCEKLFFNQWQFKSTYDDPYR